MASPRVLPRVVGSGRETLVQAFLSGVSGVLALLVDASVLWALATLVGIHYLVAATAGMVAGIVLQFFACRGVIFPRTGRPVLVEAFLFSLVFVVGVCLNNAIMYALVETAGAQLLVAKLAATVIVFVANFVLRKWVVFRPVSAR